eukprot:3631842-Prymnesium_polylepis.1
MGEGRPGRVCRPWGMEYGGRPDRSGPLTPTPYPKPHTPDPGKVQSISDQKAFFSACLQKGTLGVAMGE